MSHARFALAVAVLAALTPLAAAGILTVGPVGSGAQFRQIQAAVNAAHEDDVLLVRAGTYQRVTVDKPLRILGVEPGVIIDGGTDNVAVLARGIAAGREPSLA
jgi:pectin methylesterase-like acyl-CoA thioesterase